MALSAAACMAGQQTHDMLTDEKKACRLSGVTLHQLLASLVRKKHCGETILPYRQLLYLRDAVRYPG